MSSKRPSPQRPSGGPAPETRSGHASDTKPIGVLAAARPHKPAGATQRTIRETIESIVVAFVLAFLFRTFEAEAFVIPTGSMAPTLQGRHKDLICPQCKTHYRVGASLTPDEETRQSPQREVTEGTCPNCRYTMNVDPATDEGREWPAYNGDRILVAKFPYDFSEPSRWDVIVFRYPLNGQMNFIKRLVGLPGETLRIDQGDIYTKPEGTADFEIVRKPATKVWAMAQDVYNNDYIVDAMTAAGWPLRWQPAESQGSAWTSPDGGRSFETAGGTSDSWIRYRHFIPSKSDWRAMSGQGQVLAAALPRLITDFYAYNTFGYSTAQPQLIQRQLNTPDPPTGLHWVGDLMLDATLDVRKPQGSIVLDLVKGGRHFQCDLNAETGEASLGIDGLPDFRPTAQTSVRGAGRHRVSFANVDRKLFLWVDEELVPFAAPTTYDNLDNAIPTQDDLAPAGIASRGADVKVEHLVLKRDIYYIAKRASDEGTNPISDYDFRPYDSWNPKFFASPDEWTRDSLFSMRRSVDFQLDADQFFALGDNSPQSKDSRLWTDGDPKLEFYVRRELLIGQALFIYWPASHNRIPYLNIPFPLFPNFQDMGFIR